MAGAEDVGEGQQRGQQVVVGGRVLGELHEGAVGEGHAHGLALTAVVADGAPEAAVLAGRRQALAAVVADAVGPHEGRDHQVTAPDRAHLGAGLLDDAEELVPDPLARLPGRLAAVRPQVAAADAGAQHPDHGVGRQLDDGLGHVLHAHVVGGVDGGGAHGRGSFSCGVGRRGTAALTGWASALHRTPRRTRAARRGRRSARRGGRAAGRRPGPWQGCGRSSARGGPGRTPAGCRVGHRPHPSSVPAAWVRRRPPPAACRRRR